MRRGTLSGRKKRRGCRQAVPAQCGYGSGLITAAAHELPQQRGLGNVVRRQGQEVVQEFQKPLGLQIFRAVMGHAEQQRLHIGLQQGCFVDQSGVEHGVGAVLIGEDVLPPRPGGRRATF